MTKKERINTAYQHIRTLGVVRTQRELATLMGASASNISSALNGVESVLTDRFLHRFNEACNNIFDINWLLTGEGEMLKSAVKEAAASTPAGMVSLEKLYALIEQLVRQGEMNAEANLRNAKANEQNAANIARLIDGYMGGYKGAEERKIG